MKKKLLLTSKGVPLWIGNHVREILDIEDYSNIKIVLSNEITITVNEKNILDYDSIFFRSWIKSAYIKVVYALTKYLNYHKKKYSDSFAGDVSFSSKLFQYVQLHLSNVLIPKTVYIPTVNLKRHYPLLEKVLGNKFILKGNDSDKGNDNYLISSEQEFIETLGNANFNLDIEYICQEFIENSFDYRILVADYKAASVEIRKRKEGYRNNVAVGAEEIFININQVDKRILQKSEEVAKLFKIELCGVDIIVSPQNEIYLLEANCGPGITKGSIEQEAVENFIINF